MAFTLPELPYKLDALKPFLSEEQMTFHYTKHHAAYLIN
jgi:Fe-Mn family superoxide dismutase